MGKVVFVLVFVALAIWACQGPSDETKLAMSLVSLQTCEGFETLTLEDIQLLAIEKAKSLNVDEPSAVKIAEDYWRHLERCREASNIRGQNF